MKKKPTVKVSYATPRVRDHGSIADHTFRKSQRVRVKISNF